MKIKKRPDMVNVFIRNKNNYALLIHNIGYEGKDDRWEMPGGKVKDDEDLEKKAINEPFDELGIGVKLIRINGKKIFGDYETQTPEGIFLCRTYFAKITYGKPKIMEKKHDKCDYFNYNKLLQLHEQKILVPNLVLALPKLKAHMD